MRIVKMIVGFVLAAASVGVHASAQAAPADRKPPRGEIRMLEVTPPKPPKPAPGEFVEIDRVAGLARLRSLCADGAYRDWSIEVPDLMVEPAFRSTVTAGPQGKFRYVFEVSNGAKARRAIAGFVLDVNATISTGESTSPSGWSKPTINSWPVERRSVGWLTGTNGTAGIGPVQRLGGFTLDSNSLPGLTKVCFISSGTGVVKPSDFDLASDWAHKVLSEEIAGARVCLPAIAPKLQPDLGRSELMEAIRNEFTQAAAKEEFASIREELERFLASLAPGRAPATPPKGKTALQREFLAAMELNLAVAQSRPD